LNQLDIHLEGKREWPCRALPARALSARLVPPGKGAALTPEARMTSQEEKP
jgi:hypothetical protein